MLWGRDTDGSKTESESGINDLMSTCSYNMAIKEKEYERLQLEKTPPNGDAKLLGISIPFVYVKDMQYENTQPDQYTWFYAILETLYRKKVRFTGDELHYCLITFWCHYQLLVPKLKIIKMWKQNIPVAMKWSMEWDALCAYWDMECHTAIFLNEPFNQFIFNLFYKMIFTKDSQMMATLFTLDM